MEAKDMVFLSWLYEKESKDYDNARYWMENAIEHGDVRALELKAISCYEGTNLYEKDIDLAFRCFEQAAILGSSDAMVFLGLANLAGVDIPCNHEVGLFWLISAKDLGNEEADKIINDILAMKDDKDGQ